MSDAFIRKATITNALIGANITSQAQTNYGQAIMSLDFQGGQMTIQHPTINGRYIQLQQNGLYMVSGGVALVELSLN
jgi:hypothetical protein